MLGALRTSPSISSRASCTVSKASRWLAGGQGHVRWLSLAYTLHEPHADRLDSRQCPIIIMHGLFGSKQNNRSISKAIARDLGAPIYAIDLRNHGDSPHDPRHDYTSMAADVEEFMHEHQIEQGTIIGHSMGAKVAMVLALSQPRKVGALIPVDNTPADVALGSDFGRYVQGMRKIEQAGCKKQADADAILQPFEDRLAIRQFLLTNLIRDSESGTLRFKVPVDILGGALDHMGDFPFKDPDTHRYDGPTLLIRGSQSPYVPDELLPLVGQFFPRFEVQDIDSGHWVISEKPDDFRRAVVEFLRPVE